MGQVSQRVLRKQEKEAREAGKASFFLAWVSLHCRNHYCCLAPESSRRHDMSYFVLGSMLSAVKHCSLHGQFFLSSCICRQGHDVRFLNAACILPFVHPQYLYDSNRLAGALNGINLPLETAIYTASLRRTSK